MSALNTLMVPHHGILLHRVTQFFYGTLCERSFLVPTRPQKAFSSRFFNRLHHSCIPQGLGIDSSLISMYSDSVKNMLQALVNFFSKIYYFLVKGSLYINNRLLKFVEVCGSLQKLPRTLSGKFASQ